uniref:Uncharacterized protein n=1 Tax=Solanum lycopersicum TaxID=4081 RepID=K4CD45_SOLLC
MSENSPLSISLLSSPNKDGSKLLAYLFKRHLLTVLRRLEISIVVTLVSMRIQRTALAHFSARIYSFDQSFRISILNDNHIQLRSAVKNGSGEIAKGGLMEQALNSLTS